MIKILGGWTAEYLKPTSLLLKGLSNSMRSTAFDTVTLRSSQHKLECRCAWYCTKTNKKKPPETKHPKNICYSSISLSLIKLLKRLVFLWSQSLNRSFPSPVAEQAEPASLKFLITGICFAVLGLRQNI